MKLAIWTSRFPDITETFIESEVKALNDSGVDLQVCSLKSAPASKMKVIFYYWFDPRNLWAWIRVGLSQPKALMRIIGELMSGFKNCPRPYERFKSLLLLPLACRASYQLKGEGVTHLMSHWANVPSTMAWAVHRLQGWPYVMVLHGENLSSVWPHLELKCREAAKVVTCTTFNKERLENQIEGLTVEFHSHGVFIPPESESKLPETFTGLSVGRLVSTKGYMTLLKALKFLRDEGHDFRWLIVGSGPQENELRDYMKDSQLESCVTIKKECRHEEVLALYKTHHVFVLPIQKRQDGDSDGLPNVILEAMAACCPLIATDFPTLKEALKHDENALLVKPEDDKALAFAILNVMSHPDEAKRRVQNARATLKDRYNREECHQKLFASLDDVWSLS